MVQHISFVITFFLLSLFSPEVVSVLCCCIRFILQLIAFAAVPLVSLIRSRPTYRLRWYVPLVHRKCLQQFSSVATLSCSSVGRVTCNWCACFWDASVSEPRKVEPRRSVSSRNVHHSNTSEHLYRDMLYYREVKKTQVSIDQIKITYDYFQVFHVLYSRPFYILCIKNMIWTILKILTIVTVDVVKHTSVPNTVHLTPTAGSHFETSLNWTNEAHQK